MKNMTTTSNGTKQARLIAILLDSVEYINDTMEVLYAELDNPSQYAKDRVRIARKFAEVIKKLEKSGATKIN